MGNSVVDACFLGLDPNGVAHGNSYGVWVFDSPSNIIGAVPGVAGVGGNVISGNLIGVRISGLASTGNTVASNLIGTDPLGLAPGFGNTNDGVYVTSGASNNHIGHEFHFDGNLISGNGRYGVNFDASASDNFVRGNVIGLNANGNAKLANGSDGVFVQGDANDNTIGGSSGQTVDFGNIISGNTGNGVRITIDPNTGLEPNGTQVLGNWIGLGLDGSTALGNSQNGVYVVNAVGTQIGNPTERNVISGNTDYGVFLYNTNQTKVASNYIGIAADGSTGRGNQQGGVIVEGGATLTTIGGNSRNLGNVISGNTGNTDDGTLYHNGITLFDCSETTVGANYIGTDASGTQAVPNSRDGIYLTVSATMNTIGLPVPEGEQVPYQVISGNGWYGIEVDGTTNTIDFNLVGLGVNFSNLRNGKDWRLDDSVGGTNTWGEHNIHNN